ncbi:GspH/FimT family protein [Streptomyces sp. DH37]|uniref:GspH/FimT family protein n=1 Tax=Streptomyces sp. DH37 TaxID=3040122 RepID=UPI002442509D|nr:GspH/FimT family protein [Streptomyces sp. DH37]MDG9704801.1 GspH/FimT family protein [Streptomyces sp. DH37]
MGSDGLQIQEAEGFQRKEWAFERVGWAVMALILLAALLGLFGGLGVFRSVSASDASGAVTVDYPRLTRHTARTELEVATGAAAVREGQVVLTLSSDWVDGADIGRVIPEPDTWSSGPDGLRLTFLADPAPPTVRISYRPDAIGPHPGTVTVGDGGPRVGFDQFVYP